MNSAVSAAPAAIVPAASAAASSARSVVVPTATTRAPRARAAATAAAVAGGIRYHSLCIRCAARSSSCTGANVPAPTCSVTQANAIPAARSVASIDSSKCRPAVGAATAPGWRA